MKKNNEFEKERNKIIAGLEESYKKLLAFKKAKGSPVVVFKNGEILEIDADKMPSVTLYRAKI